MRSINQIVVEGVLTDAGLSLDAVPQILRAMDRATTNGYDLDENEALQLIYEQGAVCAICKSPFDPAVAPIVEHRHEDEELGRTHLVRGFVCPRCNAACKNYDGVEAHSKAPLAIVWWAEYNQRPMQRKAEILADRIQRRAPSGRYGRDDVRERIRRPAIQAHASEVSLLMPKRLSLDRSQLLGNYTGREGDEIEQIGVLFLHRNMDRERCTKLVEALDQLCKLA